ncbi:L,D-transpeptidase family protein [Natronincola ferrireducens]|uniref:L,D-transpeptidase catalytic domain n=1 Tax=Natronincola ferrireducens TaxID=393762 RepID=A0A1G9ELY8_9FIRM|nr:L,D-transpeptidase family protein [Natronincola ferrireducens]SDK77202.1 L,D-transpeptidase catalytic domain [Natronincola ferrireducens]
MNKPIKPVIKIIEQGGDSILTQFLSLCIAATMLVPVIGDAAENHYMGMEEDTVLEEHIPIEEFDEHMKEDREKNTTEKKEIDYTIALRELGYYKEDHASKDINMRNAVLRFQSEHNLVVDGSFGPRSTKALQERLQDKEFRHSDVITNTPTDKHWIAINKTKRILTLYYGNEVIKKYPIAQGKHPSATPEGKFTIVNKLVNPAWGGAGISAPVAGGSPQNPLGYRWMGISHKGGGSYGIHGNNSPTSIGTNVSLGCVRMINSDVEELYELVNTKTPVWIGTDEKLKQWGVHNKSYAY